jgi:hypothetical protein
MSTSPIEITPVRSIGTDPDLEAEVAELAASTA